MTFSDLDYDTQILQPRSPRPETSQDGYPRQLETTFRNLSVVCIGGEMILLGAAIPQCSGEKIVVGMLSINLRGVIVGMLSGSKFRTTARRTGTSPAFGRKRQCPMFLLRSHRGPEGSPTSADLERILGYTPNAYAAAEA